MNNTIIEVIKELEKIYGIIAKKFNIFYPIPLITIQSKGRKKNTLGWYSKDKWLKDKEDL